MAQAISEADMTIWNRWHRNRWFAWHLGSHNPNTLWRYQWTMYGWPTVRDGAFGAGPLFVIWRYRRR